MTSASASAALAVGVSSRFTNARRRVEATRTQLVSVEGIPEERLGLAESKESAMPGEGALPKESAAASRASAESGGRVEFVVVAGGE